MKVAMLGVGHWHTPLYLEPLLAQPGVRIVGVCDRDPAVAQRYADRLGCVAGTDWADVCHTAKPDLAFVLGRHSDMAATVRFLIDEGIPLVVEKPAGLNQREVGDLAKAAAAAGAFAAVPLVFRSSGFMAAIAEHAPGEAVWYGDFKFVAGLPSRYHASGCDWVFDRRLSGGGTLVNLGVHFIDLFQILTSVEGTELTGAVFANLHGEGDVDDYAALSLRNGRSIGRVETAYLYPAPAGIFDMHFSVRTDRHYIRTVASGEIEVSEIDGKRHQIVGTTTNMPIYPTFVADVIRQCREGAAPVADLADMANVMRAVDRAYEIGAATEGVRAYGGKHG